MRELSSVIPPLSPDYAGAASVFYPLGGTILINGASGCLSNYAGYDEPRLLDKQSLILSSGLRDVRAIFGDEDFLTENLPLLESLEWSRYLLLLSSPAACIFGTDHAAVARSVERDLAARGKHISVFSFETTGIDSYDKGEESATKVLLDYALACREDGGGARSGESGSSGEFEGLGVTQDLSVSDELWESAGQELSDAEQELATAGQETQGFAEATALKPRVLFVGCSPLSIWGKGNLQYLESLPDSWGIESAFMLGKDSDITALEHLGQVDYVVACSAGSLKPARKFAKTVGAELVVGLTHRTEYAHDIKAWAERSQQMPEAQAVGECANKVNATRILVLADQVYAHSLRLALLEQDPSLDITCASLFAMDKKLKCSQDVALHSEAEVKALLTQNFDLILADPLIQGLCTPEQAFIPLPHIAVSSRLFMHAIPLMYGESFVERVLEAARKARVTREELHA